MDASVVPFQLTIESDLSKVLNQGLIQEATEEGGASPKRVQLIRYHAGSDTYARLVRVEIEVSGQRTWRLTPASASDYWHLKREIPANARLTVRLVRGEGVDASSLPDLSAYDVRLEVLG